jgi:hypothetical protein
MDNNVSGEQLASIKETLRQGRKIDAIKQYREAAGLGLAEAKEAVEKLEGELRASSPHDPGKTEARGCLGVLIVLLLLAGTVIRLTLG